MKRLTSKTLFVLTLMCSASWSHAASKVALIIGNSEYNTVSDRLKNPVNDASDVARFFKEAGYETKVLTNATLKQFLEGLNEVDSLVDSGGTIVFYYAGHGIQFDGQNYLIPIDATLANRDLVVREAISLRDVISKFQDTRAGKKVLFIDACRNDPFPKAYRSVERGLRRMQDGVLPDSLMISYAASPGQVALDGQGRNGVFTAALLGALQASGANLAQVMDGVIKDVGRQTGGQQRPYYEGAGFSEVVLNEAKSSAKLPILVSADVDTIYWDSIRNTQYKEDYEEYLNRFPSGMYVSIARSRVRQLAQVGGLGEAISSRPASTPIATATPAVSAPVAAVAPTSTNSTTAYANAQSHVAWSAINQRDKWQLEAFIRQNPNSVYSREAKIALAKIDFEQKMEQDEERWWQISSSENFDDFDRYLKEFPSGKYRLEAQKLHKKYGELKQADDKLWQDIASTKNIARIDAYLATASYIYHKPQAEALKQQILTQRQTAFETAFKTDQAEKSLWEQIKNSQSAHHFLDYLIKYPQGEYVKTAVSKAREFLVAPSSTARAAVQDCAACPELLPLPLGQMLFDGPKGGYQLFKLSKPLYLAKYEVTFKQYNQCVQDGSCRAVTSTANDAYPVTGVSWTDTQAYSQWLSQKTGKKYRLPTGGEWEYGARAGSYQAWWFGEDSAQICQYGNVADSGTNKANANTAQCNDGAVSLSVSGAYKANPWGFYDMIGNASEWVNDCMDTEQQASQCQLRALRGGSWAGAVRETQPAVVAIVPYNDPFYLYGFRVLRDVN